MKQIKSRAIKWAKWINNLANGNNPKVFQVREACLEYARKQQSGEEDSGLRAKFLGAITPYAIQQKFYEDFEANHQAYLDACCEALLPK